MVFANNENNLVSETSEEQCLLGSRVAAADNIDAFAPIEHAIAGGAVRDAMRGKLFLAIEAGPTGRSSTCKNDGTCCESSIWRNDAEEAVLCRTGYVRNLPHADLSTEVCRLRPHCLGERVPVGVRKSRIVVYLAREDGLTSKRLLLERHRIE